jgi:hypothetical protein
LVEDLADGIGVLAGCLASLKEVETLLNLCAEGLTELWRGVVYVKV